MLQYHGTRRLATFLRVVGGLGMIAGVIITVTAAGVAFDVLGRTNPESLAFTIRLMEPFAGLILGLTLLVTSALLLSFGHIVQVLVDIAVNTQPIQAMLEETRKASIFFDRVASRQSQSE
jgi:hypothetical protein